MTTRIKKNIAKFAIDPEGTGFCKQMIMKEITLRQSQYQEKTVYKTNRQKIKYEK